jgi:mRNA interferase YafQ
MTVGPYRYAVRATGAFRKSAKRAAKRGKDVRKLKRAVELLARGDPLPAALRDHALAGLWKGHRELHLEPDWLLVYRIEENILVLELVDTGSHADLFGK